MIKYGVIGSGWIAEEFVKGASGVEGMKFSAMYSRTFEKGKEFVDKFISQNEGIKIYTDLDKFAKSDIDAVYIASPNFLHFEQSKLMLENGKNVLCEKPITNSPSDFEQLLKLSEKQNLVYTEAIMMLHQPARETIKTAIKTIGKISSAHFDFSQLSSKYSSLKSGKIPNIFNPKMQTGCLRDLGIYCFYPAVDFFGFPDKIFSSSHFMKTGADSDGITVLDYSDKFVTLTYSKIGQDCCGSQIIGDEGTITIGSISKLTNINVFYNDGRKVELIGDIEKNILMGNEAKNFKNYITDYKKYEEEYKQKNSVIFDVNSMIFDVKNKCEII